MADGNGVVQLSVVDASDSMYCSLNQAHREWHKAKSTIGKAIKAGRLQRHLRPNGEKLLLRSELANLWGPPPDQADSGRVDTSASSSSGQERTAAESSLEAVIKAKDETILALREQIARLEDQVRYGRQSEEWFREQMKTRRALPARRKFRLFGGGE